MDLSKLPVFAMMSRRMEWLGKRQQVLAQNVANADTPGFRAADLKEPSFREMLGGTRGGVAMAATNARHLSAAKGVAGNYKAEETKGADISLSKNSVDVEEEMMKVTQTAMDHQLTVNLYRKHIAMIKAALGRPGG